MSFIECLKGVFDNKKQALAHPSRYARIIVKHEYEGDGWFFGSQSYWHSQDNPYRQFKMLVSQEGEKFRIQNFDSKGLTYKQGCDTLFEIEEDHYHGRSVSDEHKIDVILTEYTYSVFDMGKNWGSKWGHLVFHKVLI